jgi:predicted RNA-binding protein with PIN domain
MVRVLFLVDGYNVTRGDPATSGLALERQREALVRRLATRGTALLGAGSFDVVFDGPGGAGTSRVHGPVTVRFAPGSRTADDVIVALAARAAGPVTIVTSDAGLASRARAHGDGARVVVLPRERLYESARARGAESGRRRGVAGGSVTGVPKGANRITEELKQLWLDEGASPSAPDEKE